MERVTLAMSVGHLTEYKTTKYEDLLTIVVEGREVVLPLNADSSDSPDPLLDAISEGESVGIEIVKYV